MYRNFVNNACAIGTIGGPSTPLRKAVRPCRPRKADKPFKYIYIYIYIKKNMFA